jgi:hypothetical protein
MTPLEIVIHVIQGRPECARSGAAPQQPDGFRDRHADLEKRRKLPREQDEICSADPEKGRHLAIQPVPSTSSLAQRNDSVTAQGQVAMHDRRRLAVYLAVFQLAIRRIGSVLVLGGDRSALRF